MKSVLSTVLEGIRYKRYTDLSEARKQERTWVRHSHVPQCSVYQCLHLGREPTV